MTAWERSLCASGRWWCWLSIALLTLLLLAACEDIPPTATPIPTTTAPQGDTAVLPTLDLAQIPPSVTPTPSSLPPATDTAVPSSPTTTAPTVTPSSPPAVSTPTCLFTYTMLESNTTPGGNLLPGAAFLQTWRVRNDGTCAWGAGAAWVFVSGEQLGGPDLIALPPAGTGQTVDVNLALTAPANPGSYTGFWQPQMANGLLLQPPSGMTINVVLPAAPSTPVPAVIMPTATAVPSTPTATPFITGWRGEYFNNQTLSGAPVLVRDDPEINFNWGTSSPGAGLQNGNFSVRWTRTISAPGGVYRFFARSEDGVRVWVNGALLFDEWHNGQNATYQSEVTLQPGQQLNVRVEYYHVSGLASARVWAEEQSRFPQWRGAYIADPNLQGQPALVRNDADINFNWGLSAPAAGLPSNNFSVIWIRTLAFATSGYRFNATVDDGMRLYVDDVLVIDAWQDGTVRQVSGTVNLLSGHHDVVITYYERHNTAEIRVWWEQVTGFE